MLCKRQRQCARIPRSRFLRALANLASGAMPLSLARRDHCSPVSRQSRKPVTYLSTMATKTNYAAPPTACQAAQRRPNISLHPDFNEMVGFTGLEVRHLVETRPTPACRGSATV